MLANSSLVSEASMAAVQTAYKAAELGSSSSPPKPQRATSPREENEADCMAFIRRALNDRNIPQGAQNIIFSSWRDSTKSIYSTYVRQWIRYCCVRGRDPFRENVGSLLDFLTSLHLNGRSYNTIHTAKSAISTVMFFDLTSSSSNQNIIKQFMRGLYHSNPPRPRYSNFWDVNLVLRYYQRLGPSSSLSTKDLTKKCALLLGLLSAQRVQTVHVIKLSNMQLFADKLVINISDLLKQSAPSRNNPVLEFPKFEGDETLCIMSAIETYVTRTSTVRQDDYVFLSFNKPYRSVTKSTIARWIKDVLSAAGIDTDVFGPHSIRGAASTAAASHGVSLEKILSTAGWSNASTFARFYHKQVEPPCTSSSVCSVLQAACHESGSAN